jgi:beta-galactosidase
VRAVGQWAGRPGECAHFELTTTGAPARLELTADPFEPAAGPLLVSIQVRIVDAAGHRVFGAASPISVSVEGPGELVALDNSDPRDVTSVRAGHRTAYQGRILALVRTGSEAGLVTVRASADGMPAAELQLRRIPAAN